MMVSLSLRDDRCISHSRFGKIWKKTWGLVHLNLTHIPVCHMFRVSEQSFVNKLSLDIESVSILNSKLKYQ